MDSTGVPHFAKFELKVFRHVKGFRFELPLLVGRPVPGALSPFWASFASALYCRSYHEALELALLVLVPLAPRTQARWTRRRWKMSAVVLRLLQLLELLRMVLPPSCALFLSVICLYFNLDTFPFGTVGAAIDT